MKNNLSTLILYLTNDCNLACQHCWLIEGNVLKKRSFLGVERFQNILKEAISFGLKSIRLTGGEPLIHPDFESFIKLASRYNLPVAIETNGTLLTKKHITLLAETKDPFVSVSLDGSNPECHDTIRNMPGCFDLSVEAIRILVENKIPTEIIMTLQGDNSSFIGSMIELAEDLNVNALKINIMQPVGGGEKLKNNGKALDIQSLITIGKWLENDIKSNIRIFYDHPPAFKPLHKLCDNHSWKCATCHFTNILSLLPEGSISFCGGGQHSSGLLLGDSSQSLSEIWNDHPLLNELRQNLPKRLTGVCSMCIFRDKCIGGCIAQTYYLSGSFYGPFWYCQEAFDHSLFPSGRLFTQQT